ncbi:hypothetical protein FRZ67_06750 [Panacibacter ginsenosidivorans]|uniref:Uncharacterized protein n=1 Tax=Panacibacter ginsenosidivorans TaxID=1813871 RepID=A0A5B8V8H2_9BACT|nr:hypothetical protein [Panacibacter ginsenosidivorans]QEC67006.1 hypothetical protein FRZ67_06750 [Panacibacter ginsenosidivorans]
MFSYKFIRILFCLEFVIFAGIVADTFLLNTTSEKDYYDHILTYTKDSYDGNYLEGKIITHKGKVLSLPDDWDYYFEYGQPLFLHVSLIFKQPLYFETSLKGQNTIIPVNSVNSSLGLEIFVLIAALCFLISIISIVLKKYPNDMVVLIAMLFGLFSCLLFFW